MKVSARYLGTSINIRELKKRKQLEHFDQDVLIKKIEGEKLFVVFKYGVVVCWQLSEREKKREIENIMDLVEDKSSWKEEETEIITIGNSAKNTLSKGRIYLKNSGIEEKVLVSSVIAKSLVIDFYEQALGKTIPTLEETISSLEKTGKLRMSTKSLIKYIGLAMRIRHATTLSLAVVEKPDSTWEDRGLDKFYSQLSGHFELNERFDILSRKLNLLSESLENLLDFINTRKSMWLELIIIALFIIDLIAVGLELYLRTY